VWQHMPVWVPVRRFFRRYGIWPGNPARGQYRKPIPSFLLPDLFTISPTYEGLIGNVGFWLGVLSGLVLCSAIAYGRAFVFAYLIFPLFS